MDIENIERKLNANKLKFSNNDCERAMLYSAQMGNFDITKFFIEKWYNPLKYDINKHNVLTYASLYNDMDFINFLSSKGFI